MLRVGSRVLVNLSFNPSVVDLPWLPWCHDRSWYAERSLEGLSAPQRSEDLHAANTCPPHDSAPYESRGGSMDERQLKAWIEIFWWSCKILRSLRSKSNPLMINVNSSLPIPKLKLESDPHDQILWRICKAYKLCGFRLQTLCCEAGWCTKIYQNKG